ncbi:MAG: STAS domain-containing protein [Pseudomonadota bacterium]
MNLEVIEREGGVIVKLHDQRLDHRIATKFRDRVIAAALPNRPMVLDLELVEFMDSSGLGAVVGIRKRLGWSVRIVLAGVRSPVFRVFELAKMTGVFTFYTSVASALSHNGNDLDDWDDPSKGKATA